MRGPLLGLAAAARLTRNGPKTPTDALTELLLLAERRARAPVQGRGEAPLALPPENARIRGLRLALLLLLRTRHGAVYLRVLGPAPGAATGSPAPGAAAGSTGRISLQMSSAGRFAQISRQREWLGSVSQISGSEWSLQSSG